jgi:glycosyltransferase involved in cell wall biosynthesis
MEKRKRAGRVFERYLLRRADCIIILSRGMAEEFSQRTDIPPSRIEVVGDGIDLNEIPEDFDRNRFRRVLGISPSAPVIVSIGRLDPVKDHLTLLRAT